MAGWWVIGRLTRGRKAGKSCECAYFSQLLSFIFFPTFLRSIHCPSACLWVIVLRTQNLKMRKQETIAVVQLMRMIMDLYLDELNCGICVHAHDVSPLYAESTWRRYWTLGGSSLCLPITRWWLTACVPCAGKPKPSKWWKGIKFTVCRNDDGDCTVDDSTIGDGRWWCRW